MIAASSVDLPPNTATWTPTLTLADDYNLFALWGFYVATRATNAPYTIHRVGGVSTITVNQKQNGGQWRLLSTYNFAPGLGHGVSLAASADGRVVADAIRLVAASGPTADIVYIHPDQLGSPQKMTDAVRAVVWDRQAGPFGELETIAGLAAMPLRFPGQYADAETSFNYNYFRDYDPALGRYVESDPIGLLGGLNTYAYVGGNPLIYADPTGKCPWCVGFVVGVGLDLAFQLIENGGNWRCLDVQSLLISGALGAVGAGGWTKFADKGLKLGMKRPNAAFPRGWERVERSRSWPGRWGGPHSWWNEQLIWGSRHAVTDPKRYQFMRKWWRDQNDIEPWLNRLWERTPPWLKGGLGGGAVGATIDAATGCECR